jgi:diaminohydroxyphosphoribosylaminopyrimidine deaminase/5-amino-6-(5-phosphoribosylamino)uracil reductase
LPEHQQYMHRCLELAQSGAGYTAPNPMVGAVLVHAGKIIGEGFHKVYGGPHAEVNCINAVKDEDREFISSSTLYVSLEPCAHFGKTPPCADLIIRNKIPEVVVGCRDPFVEVDGKGIEKLKAAGVAVIPGVLEAECKKLNRRFLGFHSLRRPYIILKWAETGNKKIGVTDERLHITGSITNRLVHKWRSEEAAILIGTATALSDDPRLTNRLWNGASPVRVIIDKELRLPRSLHVFDGSTRTIIINTIKHEELDNVLYYQVTHDVNLVHQVLNALYQLNILSVLVEGGAKLLQSFIDDGLWDEARVITNEDLSISEGIASPVIENAACVATEKYGSELVRYYHPSF